MTRIPPVSLPKGRPTVSLSEDRPQVYLRKEQDGKKKCTVRRTHEQYENLKNPGLLRGIGLEKTLTSEEIQTLLLREIGLEKTLFGRQNENRTFPIKIRKYPTCCGNNVCTCTDP